MQNSDINIILHFYLHVLGQYDDANEMEFLKMPRRRRRLRQKLNWNSPLKDLCTELFWRKLIAENHLPRTKRHLLFLILIFFLPLNYVKIDWNSITKSWIWTSLVSEEVNIPNGSHVLLWIFNFFYKFFKYLLRCLVPRNLHNRIAKWFADPLCPKLVMNCKSQFFQLFKRLFPSLASFRPFLTVSVKKFGFEPCPVALE